MPPCNSRRTPPPVPAQRTLRIHSIRSIHHSSNILFPQPLAQLLSRIIQRTRQQQHHHRHHHQQQQLQLQQHQLLAMAMAIATVALAACCIHRSYRAVRAPATAITSATAAVAATITITAAATATQPGPMAMAMATAAITATAAMRSLLQLPRQQQQQHRQPATWHSNCCARRPSYTQRARSAQHWPVWCSRRAVSGKGKKKYEKRKGVEERRGLSIGGTSVEEGKTVARDISIRDAEASSR